jgi:hypothetical protein
MLAKVLLLALAVAAGPSAMAAEETIRDLPLAPQAGSGRCPAAVRVSESFETYEGGFRWTGTADLSGTASKPRLLRKSRGGAVWTAILLPEFHACRAAGLGKDEAARHVEVRAAGGRLDLMLRMAALRDANGSAPQLIKAGIRDGKPVWQWAGTD